MYDANWLAATLLGTVIGTSIALAIGLPIVVWYLKRHYEKEKVRLGIGGKRQS